jgi:hypothetical protein
MASQKLSNNMVINTSVPSIVFAEIDARTTVAHITKAAIVRQLLCQWHKELNDAERRAS